MCRSTVHLAARGALLRLVVAVLVAGISGNGSRGSANVASCRHRMVFEIYNGYACDVIVTSTSDDDDEAAAMAVNVVGEVPSNASALRLTLRRAGVDIADNGSHTSTYSSTPHFSRLRGLEIVSETESFPAGLLSKLGAATVRQLSLLQSTYRNDFRLRLPPTSIEGPFAASGGSLSTLQLSDLGIEQLPANTFDELTTLCVLFLNNNRLSALPAGLFDDLCNLSSLWLGRNDFVDVEDIFLTGSGRQQRCGPGLARLQSLDLHGNQLQRLRSDAFRSLPSVVELNLSENNLSVIDAGAFASLAELRTLYIDSNRLTAVSSAMFQGLTSLTTLDVDHNRLSDISSGAFQHLAALRALRLKGNEIRSVSADAWAGLEQLTKLELSSNRLTAVNRSTFSGLCVLTKLDLADNEVSVARADAFVCLTMLERLDLSGNSLPDAERRRLEQRQWSSNDVGPAMCDECGNESATTDPSGGSGSSSSSSSSLITGCGQSGACDRGTTPSPRSSLSSVAARLSSGQLLVMALAISAFVCVLFLTLAVALYLLRRRRSALDFQERIAASSSYTPQFAGSTICTFDNSADGMYVKYHI